MVKFCRDYLVGRSTKHVLFGQVHKMEDRFGKTPPIAARFALGAPPADPPAPAYKPLPYIPAHAARRHTPHKQAKTAEEEVKHWF